MHKDFSNKKKDFSFRGLLIALCMPLFNIRYLWIGNLGGRLYVIHQLADYIQTNAPILKAAKHCAFWWGDFIFYDQGLDDLDATQHALHYEEM